MVLLLALVACNDEVSDRSLGLALPLGLYTGVPGFGARIGLDDAVVLIDEPPVYDPTGTTCTSDGSDILEFGTTHLLAMNGRRDPTPLVIEGGVHIPSPSFVPLLGGGVALRARATPLAAHDGGLGRTWTTLQVFPEDESRIVVDAVGTLEGDWRFLVVDDASQLHAVDELGGRLLTTLAPGARIAAYDGATVAVAAVVDGALVVDRLDATDGTPLGEPTVRELSDAAWTMPLANAANGTPDRFRVAVPDPDRPGVLALFEVDGDRIETAGRAPGAAVEARPGSRELLFSDDDAFHLLDEAGQLWFVHGTLPPNEACTAERSTAFFCGGMSCTDVVTASLDGAGSARAYRYVSWWEEEHRLSELEVEPTPVEFADAGVARLRFAAYLSRSPSLAIQAYDPGAEFPRELVVIEDTQVSAYVNVPRGGGLDHAGIDLRVGDVTYTLSDDLTEATVVFWEESTWDLHHAVWEEQAPPAGSVSWTTLGWLGGHSPHGATWSETTATCAGPVCTPSACTPSPQAEALGATATVALGPDDTFEVTSHFGPDGACGGEPRDVHVLTGAAPGTTALRVLDGTIGDFGRVFWIEATP